MVHHGKNRETGIQRLIENYKEIFRISENLDHYSAEDFQQAERKFVKFALQSGTDHIAPTWH